jgi:hypothetical protein
MAAPASFIPLAFEMQRSMYNQKHQPKPLIDEYEMEEFDQKDILRH